MHLLRTGRDGPRHQCTERLLYARVRAMLYWHHCFKV